MNDRSKPEANQEFVLVYFLLYLMLYRVFCLLLGFLTYQVMSRRRRLLDRCAASNIRNKVVIVARQLPKYLSRNHLLAKFQSAYRENHSTETATLKVHTDIMNTLNMKKDVILVC